MLIYNDTTCFSVIVTSGFTKYAFVEMLQLKWHLIFGELEALLYREKVAKANYFNLWHEREIYKGRWKVFGLYSFGEKLSDNCELCPHTTELVESIPGMRTAGFSAMSPSTHILPHRGYTSDVLRCHLGLIVPEISQIFSQSTDTKVSRIPCGLKVGSTIFQWEQGKAFIFDDTELHEAWNISNQTRYILLIDFHKQLV